MADAKVSALTALLASGASPTDEMLINDGGISKKITLGELNKYLEPTMAAMTTPPAAGFASDTYLSASRLVLPQVRMQAGVVYRAQIVATKTAAGTATPVFTLRTGTAGTTSDTSRASLSTSAGTAVIDTGCLEVMATFRVVGASAVLASWMRWTHDLASTGMNNVTRDFQVNSVSSAFDSTTASMGIGVSINAGASAVWTVQQCVVELGNLA